MLFQRLVSALEQIRSASPGAAVNGRCDAHPPATTERRAATREQTQRGAVFSCSKPPILLIEAVLESDPRAEVERSRRAADVSARCGAFAFLLGFALNGYRFSGHLPYQSSPWLNVTREPHQYVHAASAAWAAAAMLAATISETKVKSRVCSPSRTTVIGVPSRAAVRKR